MTVDESPPVKFQPAERPFLFLNVATAEGCVAQRGNVDLKCTASLEVNYSPPRSICAAAEDIQLWKKAS